MDKTLIKQKRLSAPEDIKELIYSFDIDDLEEKITAENKLTKEQASGLRKGTINVLIGVTRTDDFPNQLVALGITQEIVNKIVGEVDRKIFSKVRSSLEKVQSGKTPISSTATGPKEAETPEAQPNKETILNEIEYPVPTKPIVLNPAGKNPILDAQHNLPEQERKVLIPSAAVPSRGPLLNNVKTGFTPPMPPVQPIPAPRPTPPPAPAPVPVSTPAPQPTQPIQPQKPPQAPVPPAPAKYTVDPYREPTE